MNGSTMLAKNRKKNRKVTLFSLSLCFLIFLVPLGGECQTPVTDYAPSYDGIEGYCMGHLWGSTDGEAPAGCRCHSNNATVLKDLECTCNCPTTKQKICAMKWSRIQRLAGLEPPKTPKERDEIEGVRTFWCACDPATAPKKGTNEKEYKWVLYPPIPFNSKHPLNKTKLGTCVFEDDKEYQDAKSTATC